MSDEIPSGRRKAVFLYCLKCGVANQGGARFCTECGQGLVLADQTTDGFSELLCAQCNRPCPAGSQHCGWCGRRTGVTTQGMNPLLMPQSLSETMCGDGATAAMGSIQVTLPDGSRGPIYPIDTFGATMLGRQAEDMSFEQDRYMSPLHAEFRGGPTGLMVRDLGSVNGVFLRVRESVLLKDGTQVYIGHQLLRVVYRPPSAPVIDGDGTVRDGSDTAPALWYLEQCLRSGQVRETYAISAPGIVVGRAGQDVSFPRDTFVSGTHARFEPKEDGVLMSDLNASNGTWWRIEGEAPVKNGDELLIGKVRLAMMLP